MRIMGLDYGSKTVGVAISDELLLTAQGKEGAAYAVTQLSGLQIFLTSMLVGYVVLNFTRMLLKKAMR